MTTMLTRGADGLDRRGFDLSEIRRMLEIGVLDPDEKFELIDGEIVPMSPQNMPHMSWRRAVNRWFDRALAPAWVAMPEATLTLGDRPARTFETDILIFRPRPGMDAITPADVALAIEIADTTLDKRLRVKAPRYAAGGVAELWGVDVVGGLTYVRRAPGPTGYGDVQAAPFDQPIAPGFAQTLVLSMADIAP